MFLIFKNCSTRYSLSYQGLYLKPEGFPTQYLFTYMHIYIDLSNNNKIEICAIYVGFSFRVTYFCSQKFNYAKIIKEITEQIHYQSTTLESKYC